MKKKKNIFTKIMLTIMMIIPFFVSITTISFAEETRASTPDINLSDPYSMTPPVEGGIEGIGDKINAKLYEIYKTATEIGFWVVLIAIVIYLIACAIFKRKASYVGALLVAAIVITVLPSALDIVVAISQWARN